MGKTEFPVTTASAGAQAFINQGVSQLHAFWFLEAERSFMQAAAIDPQSAMAYWGIAMAATGYYRPAYQSFINPSRTVPLIPVPGSGAARAREAILKADALTANITERERLYIDAVKARNNPRSRDPEVDYVASLRRLAASAPGDLEAKVFLALALQTGYEQGTRKPRSGAEESLTLLKEVIAKAPEHPGAHHFLMHGFEDSGRAQEAWDSARIYPSLVPNIPHALHMPGHVYAQSGRFADAVSSFESAGRKEKSYMDADALYPNDHYLHNQQFLIYVLASSGQYRRALEESRALMAIPENPRQRAAIQASSPYRTGWFGLMRVLVRFEKWDEILDGATLPVYDKPMENAWYHWARGIAFASKGNMAGAAEELRGLEATIREIRRYTDPIPHQLYVARAELESLARAATIEEELLYTEPPVYPRPVLERTGRVALTEKKFAEAEQLYRRLLAKEPGSGRALWGLAQALRGQRKNAEADATMRDFERAWANADEPIK